MRVALLLLMLAAGPALGQGSAQPTVVSVSVQASRDDERVRILRDELATEITAAQDPKATPEERERRLGNVQALQREIASTQQRPARTAAPASAAAVAGRQKSAEAPSALAPDVFVRARSGREGANPPPQEPKS
jgi:hypothetical protein